MSDVMLHGILNMPPGIWDNSDIHKAQRHDAYKQASKRIAELEADNDSLNQSFTLRHKAGIRAILRWRKANPGQELTIPDLADCEVFLMDKVLELEKNLLLAEDLLSDDSYQYYLDSTGKSSALKDQG